MLMGCLKLDILDDFLPCLKVVYRADDYKEKVGVGSNDYLYNGKEKIGEGIGLNWLAYGFRYYDPAIARFTTIDPLAETYSFQSPYAYAANNPISFRDFMGLGPDGNPPINGGTLPTVTVTASNLEGSYHDQEPHKYGYKGSFSDYQKELGWEGTSYENVSNHYEQVHREGFEAESAAMDKAAAEKEAVEKMMMFALWSEMFFTNLSLSGNVATPRVGLRFNASVTAKATLYRAVSKAELDDIGSFGLRAGRGRGGGYETGKLFTKNFDNATTFGRNNFSFDGIPNHIISVRVPNSIMRSSFRFTADGMPAVNISSSRLSFLQVRTFNFSPINP